MWVQTFDEGRVLFFLLYSFVHFIVSVVYFYFALLFCKALRLKGNWTCQVMLCVWSFEYHFSGTDEACCRRGSHLSSAETSCGWVDYTWSFVTRRWCAVTDMLHELNCACLPLPSTLAHVLLWPANIALSSFISRAAAVMLFWEYLGRKTSFVSFLLS